MLSLQQKQVSYNVRRTFMTTAVRLARRFVRGRCVHTGALRAVLLRDLNWQQRRRLTFMAGLYFRTFSTSEYKNRKKDEVGREWRWRLFPQTPPTHANFPITENINQFFRFPFLFTKYCFWNCSSSIPSSDWSEYFFDSFSFTCTGDPLCITPWIWLHGLGAGLLRYDPRSDDKTTICQQVLN